MYTYSSDTYLQSGGCTLKNNWVVISGVLGGLGVALGAFGAHGLRLWLPLQKMTIFETAVRYHIFHALALLGVAVLMSIYPGHSRGLQRTAVTFTAGVVLFSGGLYGTALSDFPPFRYVVPVGGVMFVLGWGFLAYTFWSEAEK